MTEYERGFIDGIKSKVSAELTPTLINVSNTVLEMLKPVLSTALENALNDNNAITDNVQLTERGKYTNVIKVLDKRVSYFGNLNRNIEEEREMFALMVAVEVLTKLNGGTENDT